jgi:hypothetical protein
MALYHNWGVKTGFNFAPQFFMLISDGLGGVKSKLAAFKIRILSIFVVLAIKVGIKTLNINSQRTRPGFST